VVSLSRRAKNKYPLIMMPGFFSFGREEIPGIQYFGGRHDLQSSLVGRGYDVRSVEYGPFSSNWDRACEVYAFIRGGRVDYGELHSRKYGHDRFGRTYPGLYPEWSALRPVHLYGHSMGAQTARILAYLLEHGDPEEGAVAGCSPLFSGTGHNWIKSVFTLAGTHNGTTMMMIGGRNQRDLHRRAFQLLFSVTRNIPAWFDFRMEHWDAMKKLKEEPLLDYNLRLINEPFWDKTEDIAFYDLTLPGAARINSRFPLPENIYGLTFSACSTRRMPGSLKHEPRSDTHVLLQGVSRFMGSWTGSFEGGLTVNEVFFPNDGLVNTCSHIGPRQGSPDRIIPCCREPVRGAWTVMGHFDRFDHWKTQNFMFHRDHSPPGYGSYPDWMEVMILRLDALK
jgi:triacylglycerol lipase